MGRRDVRIARRVVALAVGLAACSAPGSATIPPTPGTSTPSATSSPTPSRDQGWRSDLDDLVERMEAIHPNLFHDVPESEFDAAVDDLRAGIPAMSDAEVVVGLMRLVALPGSRGRDGHSGMWPGGQRPLFHRYPFRVYDFDDGMVVAAATEPHAALVGAHVVALAGRDLEEVESLVEPLVPRDGPETVRSFLPEFLFCAECLQGLGVIDAPDAPLPVTVRNGDGSTSTVDVAPMDYDGFRDWAGDEAIRLPGRPGAMWLAYQDDAWWTTYLPDSRTLYAQYNEVREAGSSMAADLDEILDAHRVDRVVIDLRHNGGGDNTTYGALLDRLAQPDIDRPGRLLALIGRTTFSAAGNFATDLERETGVVFVGEPTGGAPNMYGDVRPVTLPYSGLTAFIASIYWQRSDPDDPRLAIAPDVAVGLSSADYFADRDPALDAALTYGG
jgi:hypothetical protein